MSLNTNEKIFLAVTLINFGGILIWLGVTLYLAYVRMNFLLGFFKRCPVITVRACLLKTGPLERLHVLGMMMGLMVVPSLFLRDGGASPEDLKNVPADLRRKLAFLQWSGWLLLLVMGGVAMTVKVGLV